MRISDWSSDVCSSDLAPEKRVGRMDENRVRLDREGQADAGKPVDGLRKTRSTLVPMFGIAKPRAAFEQPYPGCGEKAHFRGKLAGLLAAIVEVGRQLGVEKDDSLSRCHAVFGPAEAQAIRTEARRVGKEGVRKCRFRWWE